MELLHSTEVTPDQIDHLGHMNVRFYGMHAATGARVLAASLGLLDDGDRALVHRDHYVRHHHEQLVGAPLEVHGGVVDVDAGRVRLYEELRNVDTGDVAAAFVVGLEVVDRATRAAVAIPGGVARAAASRLVAIGEHGTPRSIRLDEDVHASAPALAELQRRGLAMREVRAITEAEADGDGYVEAVRLPDLVWGGIPTEGAAFEPFHEGPDGIRIGWATMEMRFTWGQMPRVGDRVQSFGAEVSLAAKTMVSRHWVLDVDDGTVAGTFTIVSLAFDVAARRAVEIPDHVRARLTENLHEDLGGS